MIFFTSDLHFNHSNIAGPCTSKWKCGFRDFNSIDEMNDTLIDNINAVVGHNDELRFLGDWAFGDRSKIPSLRERINCNKIYFIRGNHDHDIERYKNCFEWIRSYDEFWYGKTLITTFHYPIAAWNGNGKSSINLHGHCHNTYKPIGKQLDVGVDNTLNKYKPWSMDQIMDYMNYRNVVLVDHHGPNTNIY